MAKGIIYLMTTAVPGLIKIGKTGTGKYEQRMYDLEHNGYRNVTALKRTFAIEVDDYDAYHALHEEMGCIVKENPRMGLYFIADPDGCWIEILPEDR